MFRGRVPYCGIETQNPQGQLVSEHTPLNFKDIKQPKEAVITYGPHAPFTGAILESLAILNCTPCDWQQLCRTVISGGDYLIWREQCTHIAQRNAAGGWGWDILRDMGAVITTQPVPRMLHKLGFALGKGLGKYLQGDPQPISDKDLITQDSKNKRTLENLS